MLKAFKDKLLGSKNRLAGNTDLMEAVCASAALTAAADGKVDDSEIEATAKAVAANEVLRAAFAPREIEACMTRMLDRANGGRVGQMNLLKEIEEIAANPEHAEIVLLTALDIADADGTMDDSEKAMITKIAGKLGLKADTYL